jgi:hypothetical protein
MTEYISTTSRQLTPFRKAWSNVVYQSGRSVLDSELNLTQAIQNQRKKKSLPSGIISEQPTEYSSDFIFYSPSQEGFIPNTFYIPAFTANVAGLEVFVAGTEINDPELNLITLPEPPLASLTPPDPNVLNFVFLEVWRSLVTPTSSATGYIRITSNEGLIEGDTITLDGSGLVGGALISLEAGVDFEIGLTASETARNIRDFINTISTLGVGVEASTEGTEFVFLSFTGGVEGNDVILATSSSSILIGQPRGGTNGIGTPVADKIYFEGNTRCDSGLYLDDDIRDSEIGVETTKRVQVQYRLRVHETIDITDVYGFENLDIFAQGGSENPVTDFYFSRANGESHTRTTDGGLNSYPYEDTGLFVCGDGSESAATSLNSVDGYVFAIPICVVARRNNGLFDPTLAVNNGLLSTHTGETNTSLTDNSSFVIAAGTSDRPDGLFSDEISSVDVLDLRRSVYPVGLDYTSELERQFQLLLDNRNRTWFMKSSDYEPIGSSSGDVSTTPLICNEIGRSTDFGGQGGTTLRGTFIRNFDHVATRFSDIPTLERLVIEVYPDGSETYNGAVSVTKQDGSANWYEGDIITIDLSSLDASSRFRYWDTPSSAGLTLDALFPEGTKVIDVVDSYHDDGHTLSSVAQEAVWSNVSGLGTLQVSLTLDRNLKVVNGGLATNPDYKMVGNATEGDVGSPRRIILKLLIEYPANLGLTSPPTTAILPNSNTAYPTESPVIELDSDQRDPDSILPPFASYREGIREVVLERVMGEVVDYYVSSQGGFIRIPYKVYDDGDVYTPIVYDEVAGVEVGVDFEFSSLGSTNTQLAFQFPVIGQKLLRVTYYPKVAVSNYGTTGYQVGAYFRAVTPQTAGSKIEPLSVPSSLVVKPLKISDKIWVIQGGSSSSDGFYPYQSPSEQLGVHPSIFEYDDEGALETPPFIQLNDFSISTGIVSLPVLLPMDSTSSMTFQTPLLDQEARVCYTTTPSGQYKPSAFAKNLDDYAAHKNALPMLAKVEVETDLFRKGEIVLMVFSRLSENPDLNVGSNKNQVLFSSEESRTVVCVYRTQNLLLGGA